MPSIRHAMSDESNLGLEDAAPMANACFAFIKYIELKSIRH